MEAPLPGPKRSSPLKLAAAPAALLPYLCALGFAAKGPTPQEPETKRDLPALVFNQYMVNKGPIQHKRYAWAEFRFTNTGNVPVTIRDLSPSCGCLRPRLNKRTFQPGEEGQFLLSVDTPNEKPGPKEYFVQMRYEDTRPREVMLTFKVVLPESQHVSVEPRALIFYQSGSGDFDPAAFTRQITVTDHRKRGMHITGVTCNSKLVSVERGEVDVDEAGNPRMRVNVTVPEILPSEPVRALVSIATDDPEYGTLHVPLLIQAAEGGLFAPSTPVSRRWGERRGDVSDKPAVPVRPGPQRTASGDGSAGSTRRR